MIEGMNKMSEFCRCGSIMISGSCTNKSCSNKLVKVSPARVKKAAIPKTAVTKSTLTATTVKPVTKSTKVPRASKCITYNISELPPKEE